MEVMYSSIRVKLCILQFRLRYLCILDELHPCWHTGLSMFSTLLNQCWVFSASLVCLPHAKMINSSCEKRVFRLIHATYDTHTTNRKHFVRKFHTKQAHDTREAVAREQDCTQPVVSSDRPLFSRGIPFSENDVHSGLLLNLRLVKF